MSGTKTFWNDASSSDSRLGVQAGLTTGVSVGLEEVGVATKAEASECGGTESSVPTGHGLCAEQVGI